MVVFYFSNLLQKNYVTTLNSSLFLELSPRDTFYFTTLIHALTMKPWTSPHASHDSHLIYLFSFFSLLNFFLPLNNIRTLITP